MTADDLRAIALRHAGMLTVPAHSDDPDMRHAHFDRGALLSLVRRLARREHPRDCEMTGCHWCSLEVRDDELRHALDCPAPIIDALADETAAQGAKP